MRSIQVLHRKTFQGLRRIFDMNSESLARVSMIELYGFVSAWEVGGWRCNIRKGGIDAALQRGD